MSKQRIPLLVQHLPFYRKFFIPTLIPKLEEVNPPFIKEGLNYENSYAYHWYIKSRKMQAL